MNRFFALSLSVIFMVGVLFPTTRTSEGKSHFVQQIKKIFHYSDGEVEVKEKTKKGPILVGEGQSPLFQQIRNVFHYFPDDTERPKVKEYPVKFEGDIKKQIRYPRRAEETK